VVQTRLNPAPFIHSPLMTDRTRQNIHTYTLPQKQIDAPRDEVDVLDLPPLPKVLPQRRLHLLLAAVCRFLPRDG
jgi:hypothetical protein